MTLGRRHRSHTVGLHGLPSSVALCPGFHPGEQAIGRCPSFRISGRFQSASFGAAAIRGLMPGRTGKVQEMPVMKPPKGQQKGTPVHLPVTDGRTQELLDASTQSTGCQAVVLPPA